MRLGPLFRGTFEVQAGNRPLQGQSKPPVFTGGYDSHSDFEERILSRMIGNMDIIMV